MIREPVPGDMAACFVPHHRFEFLSAQGRVIGEVEVCFCCFGVESKPDLVGEAGYRLSGDFGQLRELVVELGSSADLNCDE